MKKPHSPGDLSADDGKKNARSADGQLLEETKQKRDGVLKELKQMIEKYTQLHTRLRRQERTLSIKANQHMKGMRAMETQIKAIHDYLTRCKDMHAKMLSSITQPSWAISHHYHMTSIEHTMGHTQPHILEVGDMIRGHLHIYAMANCTTQYRKQAELHLRKANADRVKAAEKVKLVYAKLRKVRTSIINTHEVLNKATKTVGSHRLELGKAGGAAAAPGGGGRAASATTGPSRNDSPPSTPHTHERREQLAGKDTRVVHTVRRNMRNMRIGPTATKTTAATTTTTATAGERGASAAARKRNSYLAVKMRYLSSLNIEHNVEVTSSMAADSKADETAAEKMDIQEVEQEFLADMKLLRALLSSYTNLTLTKRRLERKKLAAAANGSTTPTPSGGGSNKSRSEALKQQDHL
mmetsp:Transcript_13879/g.19268  ORF Transcript_13879/g.19268 Transcript_13879/m.19268 type:complete len:410 (+) Transcript_13879:130-1359(+)|eukprot:CAMPEP_0185260234 /NCGR_PEP_ID=MMETSP1359-20130426/8857_1 /TAXON_ID=552665 /ORGANISM="Bigelowiella longifila, Strain CCMP242" /LENGTH=409 /DNA_ID=CAMNT_0027846409 /DNA_START=108 /DNA_END=1337 /DNA_ORIENTATION=+